jgi:hypothetical protein
MPDKDQYDYNNGQLLFFGKLNNLKRPISVIGNENERILVVFYQQIIKLIELAHRSDLDELLLDDPLKVKEQVLDNRLLLSFVAGEGVEESLGFEELGHSHGLVDHRVCYIFVLELHNENLRI